MQIYLDMSEKILYYTMLVNPESSFHRVSAESLEKGTSCSTLSVLYNIKKFSRKTKKKTKNFSVFFKM